MQIYIFFLKNVISAKKFFDKRFLFHLLENIHYITYFFIVGVKYKVKGKAYIL